MKRIVILTGSELRHTYLRKAIALNDAIDVAQSYCEGSEKGLSSVVDQTNTDSDVQISHIASRERSEADFFDSFVRTTPELSNPTYIKKGEINEPHIQDAIFKLSPELVIAYGCSIIREPILSKFDGRLLNVHLGLSPYYRGSGTNYWALVNNEPEFFGATFMYMAAGVDCGKIIHQIRARVYPGDSPHHIGNRLICDVANVYTRLINRFDELVEMPQIAVNQDKYYRQKDFTPESVVRLYQNFANGLVERYLADREQRDGRVPIVRNPSL